MVSKEDQDVWTSYISNLFSTPETSFRPDKARRDEPTQLDLHGMSIQQAFHATNQFLTRHYNVGSKFVCIITGKGGKINEEFPHWCNNLSFVAEIEAITDTRGGWGSYFVRLKKQTTKALKA
jgi:DNA-nicking Smr family endonuclease